MFYNIAVGVVITGLGVIFMVSNSNILRDLWGRVQEHYWQANDMWQLDAVILATGITFVIMR